MTETSRFWDGTTVGDATTSPYDAGTEFAQVLMALAFTGRTANKGGVFKDDLLGLLPSSPSANTLRLTSGHALVYGNWYENSANVDTTISTPAVSTRIDRIVLRKSWAGQTVRITRIAGTEGVTTPPALVQTVGTTWDVPICQVSITTGAVITITDDRVFISDLASVDARNNLITNPGFEWAQRGTGPFTTSATLTLDRWEIALILGTSTVSFSQITSTYGSSGKSGQLVYTHVAGGSWEIRQKLEDYLQLRSRQLTFSAKCKPTVAGTVKPFIYDGTTYQFGAYNTGIVGETLAITAPVLPTANSVYVGFRFDVATCTVELNDAMLVPGSVAADYTPLTPADDLARCLRYFERKGGFSITDGSVGVDFISGSVANSWYWPLSFQVRKAVTPIMTVAGTWLTANCGAAPLASYATTGGFSLVIAVVAANLRTYTFIDTVDDYIDAVANP